MSRYRNDDRVEGLTLRRLSFFGDYTTVADYHPFRFDLACRVVKPHKFVLSRGDAASFTTHPTYKERGRRIRVVDTGLDVLHYMDVRAPAVSLAFADEKQRYWENSGDPATKAADPSYYYRRLPRQFVAQYTGPHPQSFQRRIETDGYCLDLDSPLWRTALSASEKRLHMRSRLIGWFGVRAASGRSSRKIVACHRRDNDLYLIRV